MAEGVAQVTPRPGEGGVGDASAAERSRASGIDPAALGRLVPARLQGPPASILYKAGLLLVACAMVLLPLLYLALVGAAGYGVYWHATEHLSWLEGGGSRGRLMVYASPLVAGVVLVFFLLKPLLSRPVVSEEYRPLRPEEAPLLFALARRIAAAVGAPAPDRIDVDLDVNASASRRRTDEGRQLVLTVGLPLVSGLTLRQLAGVLAHEFGHFGQGAGMRLSGWIRSLNFWFARLVYERDRFDEWLASGRAMGGYVMIFAALGSLAVWVSRGVLWVLMQAGHAISCTFMRQMEFDADRYEIALAGSATFEETAHALGRLNHATGLAFHELHESWREGRLGDDLPRLIAIQAGRLPEGDLLALSRHTEAGRTGLFDTHPSDRERIGRARRAALPGSFDLDAPGTAVFADFEAFSRAMTLDYYEGAIGPEVHATPLVSVDTLIARRDRLSSETAALERFFPALIPAYRFFGVGAEALPAPEAPKQWLARLEALHAQVESAREEARASYQRHWQASERRQDALSARALLDAGLRPDAGAFHLPSEDAEGVDRALARASANLEATTSELESFESLAAERLHAALVLLAQPKVRERLGAGAQDPGEVAGWLRAHAGLLAHEPALRQLDDQHMRLATLLTNHAGREENQPLVEAILGCGQELFAMMESVLAQLGEVEFPFDHGKDHLSVAQHLLPDAPPDPGDPAGVEQATRALLQRAAQLHDRILGALAGAAEPVEQLFGLERPQGAA